MMAGSSMSGRDIYDNFANSSGMAGLTGIGTITHDVHKSYESRADFIEDLAIRMESAWRGDAAGAARRGAGPIAVEHLVAAPRIKAAADSIGQQVEAFETAKRSIVAVPATPQKPNAWENFLSFGGANDRYERQLAEVQAANEHNVRVMQAYEQATERNQEMLQRIPSNLNETGTPWADDAVPLNPPAPLAPGSPAPRPAPQWSPPSGGGGGGSSSQQPNAQWSASPAPHVGTSPVGQTRPDAALAPPAQVSEVHIATTRPGLPGPQPGAPGLQFGPLGGGYGAGADTGRGGGGAGSRGFAAGGPGAEGGQSGGRAGGGLGGRGAGIEGAAGRGAAGGVGRGAGAGAGGAPMGAGGRANGGEDVERERPSFLVEPDPDETFGTDEVTAPPVIGG
jgi:hypothetical protein